MSLISGVFRESWSRECSGRPFCERPCGVTHSPCTVVAVAVAQVAGVLDTEVQVHLPAQVGVAAGAHREGHVGAHGLLHQELHPLRGSGVAGGCRGVGPAAGYVRHRAHGRVGAVGCPGWAAGCVAGCQRLIVGCAVAADQHAPWLREWQAAAPAAARGPVSHLRPRLREPAAVVAISHRP